MSRIIGAILSILILILAGGFVSVLMKSETKLQLEDNFHKNMVRSFEDSGMKTQLDGVSISLWSPEIEWDSLSISRNNPPKTPTSWVYIFQSIQLSECKLQFQLKWMRLKMNLKCNSIALQYRPWEWMVAKKLNSSFSTNFFFTLSEFKTFRRKQRWLDVTISSKTLNINGEQSLPLHVNYYFTTAKQFSIHFPDENLELQWYVEPEQLRMEHSDQPNHYYSFLESTLFHVFKQFPKHF